MRFLAGISISATVLLASAIVLSGCGGTGASSGTPSAERGPSSNGRPSTTAKPSPAELALRREELRAAQRAAQARVMLANRKADAVVASQSLTTFSDADASFSYPSSWNVSRTDSPGLRDVTVGAPDGTHLIRVDISDAAPSSDPEVLAAPVEKSLEGQPGYRLIAWDRTTFGGYDALRWEFVVQEHGRPLRKVDTFFADNSGSGVAILVQAPAAGYQFWTPLFGDVRRSLVVNDAQPALPATPAPSAAPQSAPTDSGSFCDTHACIANFDEGNGYIVQCADGMWSQSGGLSGACSYHGGEAGSPYDGSSGGSYVPAPATGSGDGYSVVCMDGTVSNSGGIQGACSHHGGVG